MRRSDASLPEKWLPLLKRRGDGGKSYQLYVMSKSARHLTETGHDVRHDLPSGLQTCPSVKCTLTIAQIASWSLRSERSQALHIQVEKLGCVLPVLSDSCAQNSPPCG